MPDGAEYTPGPRQVASLRLSGADTGVLNGAVFEVEYYPDAAPDSCSAIVKAENWATPLTKAEIVHFKSLVAGVASEMARIRRGQVKKPTIVADIPLVTSTRSRGFIQTVSPVKEGGCSVEVESDLVWIKAATQYFMTYQS